MKKLCTIIMMVVLIIVTGCGKKEEKAEDTITCTNEQPFGRASFNTEKIVTFEDGYLTKTETTLLASFDSEEESAAFIENYKDRDDYTVKRDGTKVTIKNTIIVSKEASKLDENKKDVIKENLENENYKCE